MKIERVELYYVAVPLPVPLEVSAQPGLEFKSNELIFVRLTTDEGVVGESAGFTLGRFYAGLGETFGHFLLGRDPLDTAGLPTFSRPAPPSVFGWHGSSQRSGTSRERLRDNLSSGCSAAAASGFVPTVPPASYARPSSAPRIFWSCGRWDSRRSSYVSTVRTGATI